jgi:uncharacterized protein (TIGR02266 family)
VTRAPLVLPVRLTIAGQSIQTTTRAVTAESVFIRSIAPPPVGSKALLRLYLPDGPPLDLRGRVLPAPPGAERGCLVALEGVGAEEAERLGRALAPPVLQPRDSKPQLPALPFWPGRGDSAPVLTALQPAGTPSRPTLDNRTLPRVPVQLRVRFESIESLEDQLALNLSSGGMFVRCAEPPPLGAEVQLLIELPGSAEKLACRSQVVHRVVQEQARTTGQVAGVGVQFLEADDWFRDHVDRFIASIRSSVRP